MSKNMIISKTRVQKLEQILIIDNGWTWWFVDNVLSPIIVTYNEETIYISFVYLLSSGLIAKEDLLCTVCSLKL